MKNNFLKNILVSLLSTAAIVGIFAALSAWIFGQTQFLGKDVSSVAVGLVQLYPKAAIWEACKILLLVSLLAWLSFQINFHSWNFQAKNRRIAATGAVVTLSTSYLALVAAGVLTYPALFEASLGYERVAILVQGFSWCNPKGIQAFAWLTFAIMPLIALTRIANRNRRAAVIILLPLVLLPFSLILQPTPQRSKSKDPNVLIIAIDSLRADKATDPAVMPHLTSFFSDPQVVQFKNHYVGIPRTFPSWIELITGRYAAENGIRHMFPGFKERSRLMLGMVTAARDNGYTTNVFSDFAGDIFPRFRAGFDSFYAPTLDIATMIRLGVDQASPALLPLLILPPLDRFFPALPSSPAYADAEKLTNNYIRALSGNERSPRFDTIFYSSAHFPYAAPYPYYQLFSDPEYRGVFRFQKNPEEPLSTDRQADIKQVRALYHGGLKSIDDQLGRLFAIIKERGMWDNTLIVVTADHGENLYENDLGQGHGEHLRGDHVLKVPLLIKVPSADPVKMRQIESISRSIDLAPTISGILTHHGEMRYRGVDFSPWIRGEISTALPKLAAYAETGMWFSNHGSEFFQKKRISYPGVAGTLSFDSGRSGDIVLDRNLEKVIIAGKHRMVLDMPFKIIFMPTDQGVEWEVYNQKSDPLNIDNLAMTEPHLLKRMQAKFWAVVREIERDRAMIVGDYVVPK